MSDLSITCPLCKRDQVKIVGGQFRRTATEMHFEVEEHDMAVWNNNMVIVYRVRCPMSGAPAEKR